MPTSQNRIEANRRNSQLSTGPKSEEGKARVAKNALKHGLLSEEAYMDWEDAEMFKEFRDALVLDLRPEGALEQLLADRIVAQSWRLRRLLRMERYLFDRDGHRSVDLEDRMGLRDVRPEAGRVHPAAIGESLHESMGSKHSAYETLRRYERTITHTMETALHDLRREQKDRAAGPADATGNGRHDSGRDGCHSSDEDGCHASGAVSQKHELQDGQEHASPQTTRRGMAPGTPPGMAPGAVSGVVSGAAPGMTGGEAPVGFVSQNTPSAAPAEADGLDSVGSVWQDRPPDAPGEPQRDVTGRRLPSP